METIRTATTHFIEPGKFLLMENALGNPDLIQSSVSSDCQVTIVDSENFPLDELEQWPKFLLQSSDIKLKNGSGEYYIYLVVPTAENNTTTTATVGFSTSLVDRNGYQILESGETGELIGREGFKYYPAGTVGQQGSKPDADTTPPGLGRRIEMDLGVTPPDATLPGDLNDYDKVFEIDKVDPTNPGSWLLTILATVKKMTARVINITEKLVFGSGDQAREATDIAVAADQGNKDKVKDTVLASTAWTKAEFEELDEKFLRKDQPDQTDHLIKFLGGLNVGEFIDSLLAGKGIGMFPDGRAQVSRLEVRDALVVMRLLINEIQAMAGDFSFSDAGCIEKVEFVEENTYKLWMEKRTEFDVTNFGESDVMYSIINNLLTGGKDYYTSWFRCLARNVNDNTLTVVLYPDSEVPGGKNYPPVAGYNVTRRGNAVMPDEGEPANERAQSWLLSSREGRILFLQNVYKPILEDYNYSISVGKFPNIKALENLPVSTDDMGVMAKTIICERLYQYDYNGDVISNKVDRGEWSLTVAQSEQPYRFVQNEKVYPDGKHTYTELEQHTVYHYGCKWGCLIDKTQDEPVWNSPSWVLLEGDKNYHLDFESTNGWQFFFSQVNTDVSAMVNYGNRDITDILMDTTGVEVEWLRDTGNVPADNSWKPTYVDGQRHVIHLGLSDMGSGWGYDYRKVCFTCRVHIPVGEEFDKVENSINIKI